MARKTLADFKDETDALPPAEEALRRAVEVGEFARIGRGARPEEDGGTDANTVRADFLRYLALGGCAECQPHEKGVKLAGAWIAGALDLEGCTVESGLYLVDCWFDGPIILRDARTRTVNLGGSRLEGRYENGACLAGDRLVATGGLFLRQGFWANGSVRLLGAAIGGDLDCSAGRFEARGDIALNVNAASIAGSVYFCDGAYFAGEVNLTGADVLGNVECAASRLEAPNARALNGSALRISGMLFMRKRPEDAPMFEGQLDLKNARAGSLMDEEACWPAKGALRLDGFHYERITSAPTDHRVRLRWLDRQIPEDLDQDLKPQPWDQLAYVLRSQGKIVDAKWIGVAKERRKARGMPWHHRPFHWLHGLLALYGYFTSRSIWLSAALIALGTLAFHLAWANGLMTPMSDVMLVEADWRGCAGQANAAACWVATLDGRDYPSFYAFLYSFDVFLPIVTIEQEPVWAPSSTRGAVAFSLPWYDFAAGEVSWRGFTTGWLAAAYRTFHEMMGYVLSGFIIAGAARLVRDD